MQRRGAAGLAALVLGLAAHAAVTAGPRSDPPAPAPPAKRGLWLSAAEIEQLPDTGAAWDRLVSAAGRPLAPVHLADQDDPTPPLVLAKALVAARRADGRMQAEVEAAVLGAIGTEKGGRTLALGRKLVPLVLAADLVGLTPETDARFRAYLRAVLDEPLRGRTLRSTHEKRPNNWGTHAGASRTAIALYLDSEAELEQAAHVFRGWLGERDFYDAFEFGDLAWQAHRDAPCGVNPPGARRDGHSIDGVLPDDQRRAGGFTWPPPKENYVYEALQGAIVTAVLLDNAGYDDVWEWGDRALWRAYRWLHDEAQYAAEGDDRWQMPLVDWAYGTAYWDGDAVSPGKNVGWTDWTHGGRRASVDSLTPPRRVLRP